MPQARSRIAIVGAGVAGLVAGRELAGRGFDVDLYERWPDVAGQASALEVAPGVWVDRYYHHLFETDADMIALHEELLPGDLEWHASTVGMYAAGRVWPFTTPRDLLSYGPLPLPDRVRLGLATMWLLRRDDWEAMDDEPAARWLGRACGPRALEAVWEPLLLGKFGDDAPTVPLAWIWSKLRTRRGKRTAREVLGYPKRSFRAICVALRDDIERRGGRVHVDREVVRLRRDAGGWALALGAPGSYRTPLGDARADGTEARADQVLITTPTHVAARLLDWPEDYAERLRGWRYRTAVVLLLELRRPVTGTYWINVGASDIPFLGLVEHTNLVPHERYPARYAYVSNYVAADDPLTRMSTDDLLAHYLPPLSRMAARDIAPDLMRVWSFREDAAQPVPVLGTRHRLLPYATPAPGVWLANTTQIYPEDRGTSYSARLGRRVADAIAGA
ncbi:MAG TPA: FAD-dependent oxidoreductase [Candidatus Limnocylindria bacterium]|nr:FAD-dependent oxidoreductase [Candidatus Limnocylindria bacterium]